MRCDTCHNAGSGQRGPSLGGRFGTLVPLEGGGQVEFDADHVRESILDPRRKVTLGYQPLMPPTEGLVTDDEIEALVAYIKSLK